MSTNTPLICLDIDGTLTDGVLGPPLPGAVEAVLALRRDFPVRLVSNTTSQPHAAMAERLMAVGLLDEPSSLVTPVITARRVLPAREHDHGVLLADEASRVDFSWFREEAAGPAVLLATEGHSLRLADLQPVFRRLLAGAAFYALERNRYYRKAGELVTDLGPLAAFLSYASGREAVTLGKPSPLLFDALASAAGVAREAIVMVGDDAEFDVAASVALGMRGVLVKTGKYQPGDESRHAPAPSAVLDSIAELPSWLGHPF
jgi:HAD superfamily hydrolase (TIGR01458 family)